MMSPSFFNDVLRLDGAGEVERLTARLREITLKQLKKRGLVVALSGGIDSSTVGAICVRALGKDRLLGLLLPEKDSSQETAVNSRLIADFLGIEVIKEDITPILAAAGCYQRRDEAIRTLIPEYDSTWKCKIVLPDLSGGKYRIFSVVIRSPEGEIRKERLTPQTYLQIVAASNFKQRVRKMMEYYHADRLNYAVAGTPNRQEYDQGFFVKCGDGAADVKPIAHLYKTQVYQLAQHLGIPEAIRRSTPTTDTYSMPQTQEEFYFSVPHDKFDLCLFGRNNGVPAAVIGKAVGYSEDRVERIYADIEQKRKATRYLHTPPVLLGDIDQVG